MPGWAVSDKRWWELEWDWKQMESKWKEIGKKLERIGEVTRGGGDCKGSAVMRGRAGNARLMSQMLYAIWFSF